MSISENIVLCYSQDQIITDLKSCLLLLKINFSTMQYNKLMHSSYKSYGGSSIDSKTKRFFTVADTPYYDSFNYSINVMEYGNLKEYLTLPFKSYSIGGMVYDPVLQKMFGFVQTPAGLKEGVKYKTYLAELQLDRGRYLRNVKLDWNENSFSQLLSKGEQF